MQMVHDAPPRRALRSLTTTRYVSPLREGGSLPALAEASDGQLYVVKFRGAGQGRKALVAELLAGEIARALGLLVPELVLMELDAAFGKHEGDSEIQDLLRASAGWNLGMQFLDGAVMYDSLAEPMTSQLASKIVWFDALVVNVDRTRKNPNLLCWQGEAWLIDHGASFYFHHNWAGDYMGRSRQPFAPLRDHLLIAAATELEQADADLTAKLTPAVLGEIVNLLPDVWLEHELPFQTPGEVRAAYLSWLVSRLTSPRKFFTP